MPRRRRNRRNKRKNQKQRQNAENLHKTNAETVLIQETPRKSDSESYFTLPNIISPLRTPSTYNEETNSSSTARTTPKSTKKCKELMNVTNLKTKIDGNVRDTPVEYLNNTTPKHSRNLRNRPSLCNSYIDNLNRSSSSANLSRNLNNRFVEMRMRSNSSVSKLHSPGLDKIPIMVDVSTQTVYFDNNVEKRNLSCDNSDVYLESCINIFETPKISQMQKLERALEIETPLSRIFQSNLSRIDNRKTLQNSNGKDVSVSKQFNNSNLKYLQNLNDVLSPRAYVSPKVIQNDLKNNESDCESSFFSPHLKVASTPIENLHKSEKIYGNLAKNILNCKLDRKLLEKQQNDRMGSYFCNASTPKTPNDKNVNSMCDNKVRTQKINKFKNCISKRRIYSSVSPGKMYKNTRSDSVMKVQLGKSDCLYVPKTFSPKRMSFTKSDSFFNVSHTNMYARFMTNIKKFHSRYFPKWFNRVTDTCNDLGIAIKKKLTGICSVKQNNCESGIDKTAIQECICPKCKSYEKQIFTLNAKIEVLDKEVEEGKNKIATLNMEIDKVKEELSDMDVIKKKIREIEEKLESKPAIPVATCNEAPPPPPPPIPPPPPPLPTSTLPSARNSKIINKKIENFENSRPVISLDDILNVKLKKTSDKPYNARRASQPLVSVEMLNQIKLRPISRPQTPCSIKDVSLDGCALSSPVTSLTKILSNVDPNVRRIKRLRRNSGYSLDDSKKYPLRRERFGINCDT